MKMDTILSSPNRLVIQITPDLNDGGITVDGLFSERKAASVFIPNLNGTKTHCPVYHFQDYCSIKEGWIQDNSSNKILYLDGISNLEQVIVSIKKSNIETEVIIPAIMKNRLLEYFKLNIPRNLGTLLGFDCHAFVCFLLNLKCFPEEPCFNFIEKDPEAGDIVAFLKEGIYQAQ